MARAFTVARCHLPGVSQGPEQRGLPSALRSLLATLAEPYKVTITSAPHDNHSSTLTKKAFAQGKLSETPGDRNCARAH